MVSRRRQRLVLPLDPSAVEQVVRRVSSDLGWTLEHHAPDDLPGMEAPEPGRRVVDEVAEQGVEEYLSDPDDEDDVNDSFRGEISSAEASGRDDKGV